MPSKCRAPKFGMPPTSLEKIIANQFWGSDTTGEGNLENHGQRRKSEKTSNMTADLCVCVKEGVTLNTFDPLRYRGEGGP